jgi:hypothetical protein
LLVDIIFYVLILVFIILAFSFFFRFYPALIVAALLLVVVSAEIENSGKLETYTVTNTHIDENTNSIFYTYGAVEVPESRQYVGITSAVLRFLGLGLGLFGVLKSLNKI